MTRSAPGAWACAATAAVLAGCVLPGESGEGDEGARWSARPGDSLVEGAFRVEAPRGADVIVRLDAAGFRGMDDPSWSIPVRDNVQFAARPAPCAATPEEAWGPVSAAGEIALRGGGAWCVAYRIVSVPSPMLDQEYRASYVVEAQ